MQVAVGGIFLSPNHKKGRLERGSNMPSLTVLCDLTKYFRITLDELLYEEATVSQNTGLASPKVAPPEPQ